MTKVGQKLLQATFPMATSQRLVVVMMMRWEIDGDGGGECDDDDDVTYNGEDYGNDKDDEARNYDDGDGGVEFG